MAAKNLLIFVRIILDALDVVQLCRLIRNSVLWLQCSSQPLQNSLTPAIQYMYTIFSSVCGQFVIQSVDSKWFAPRFTETDREREQASEKAGERKRERESECASREGRGNSPYNNYTPQTNEFCFCSRSFLYTIFTFTDIWLLHMNSVHGMDDVCCYSTHFYSFAAAMP